MIKNVITIFFLFYSCIACQNQNITLVKDGNSNYVIILSETAQKWDSLAASEIQTYINSISGTLIPIVSDNEQILENEIVIGRNKHSLNLDLSSVKDDGFKIKTENNKIFIAGNKGKGSLNGVYTFLENYLNCRMYSSKVKFHPSQKSISIPEIDKTENPIFTYRDVHYYDSFDNNYCRWHKLTDSGDKKIWGMFVHTFNQLLPPEEYFEEHPEYFALRGDHRVPEQLCLSNPKVLEIVTEELSKKIEANPKANVWSVSQGDNYSYCQCTDCKKIDDYEESNSGSVITFVNRVAKKFPNKTISTLAYQYSRKAPKYIRPEKNVNIMLCTIECFRTFPIDEDTSTFGFYHDLKEWSKITDNIFLWDYVVQFTSLISPFPNFQVLQPNIKLFADSSVKMMFQQGAGFRNASEFGELRTYLIAKLLWNPSVNVDSLINDFLFGYYGNAGKYLKEYIELMQQELIKCKAPLNIYGDPIFALDNYLTPELIDKYELLLNNAEKSVLDNTEFLERVRIARLPLIYTILEQAKVLENNKRSMVLKQNENEFIPNPQIIELLNTFETTTANLEDVFLNEKGLTPEKYISRYKTMFSKTMKNPLGLFKPVNFVTSPNFKYEANGEKTLTDGKHGDENHKINWIGFEGNNLEIIIDLQKIEKISTVSADFLQTSFSWIFLPKDFEISLSSDGQSFENTQLLINTVEITKEETLSPENAFIKNFACNFNQIPARFVKVKATNIGICPSGHPGYPFKAWIFTDEIVIK